MTPVSLFVEQLARDLGVMPEGTVVENDYTHTGGEVPTEIRTTEVLR